MARQIWIGAAIVALMGCGDPANDVLPAGSQAVVVGEHGTMLFAGPPRDRDLIVVEPGARVTVGADPARDQHGLASRLVSVVVETGKHRDAAGEMFRRDLRPIR